VGFASAHRPFRTACVAIALIAETWSLPARAYRPFDGTDAAVAEEGTMELELGPVQFLHQREGNALVAPALVLNQGIQNDTEFVLQTNRIQFLGAAPNGEPQAIYQDTGFFMKHVWRDGALQDASGPSLATEAGPLFPTAPGEHSVGAEVSAILSVVSPAATFHFNVRPMLTVDRSFEFFASTIVEGPKKWVVRPVTEVYFDRDWGAATTASWLVGGIWAAREGLDFDAAVRAADVDGAPEYEVRLGLTWALPLWSEKEAKVEGSQALYNLRRPLGG
jgi:hypothetical protein